VDLQEENKEQKKLGTIPKVPVTKKGEVVMTSPFYILDIAVFANTT
tara:strand:+ start:1338 stop:1475 length:138 start_codon:yes stop_codon:yes gene_type:complete